MKKEFWKKKKEKEEKSVNERECCCWDGRNQGENLFCFEKEKFEKLQNFDSKTKLVFGCCREI